MIDSENDHSTRLNRVEHGVWKISSENAPNGAVNDRPLFRMLGNVIKSFEDYMSKPDGECL